MKVSAVIGANFGDEGKGLVTDFLASPDSLVVRFNGGAQAGHTVVRDGIRHVFHHYGSGLLAGADTFLSKHFIVNPFLWEKEAEELAAKAAHRALYISPDALMTTPFDMLLNQALERQRGDQRHGSCGIGFNETIVRCQSGFPTRAIDLGVPQHLTEKLVAIRDQYVPRRIEELRLDIAEEMLSLVQSAAIENSFMTSVRRLRSASVITNPDFDDWPHVIFEGAQGLGLDEHSGFFPHVTRSRTGSDNVLWLIAEQGLSGVPINAYYVTRTYTTRHGAGPFPMEDSSMSFPDETNVNNEFQGALRFGRLDPEFTARLINGDAGRATIQPAIFLTHVDQVLDEAAVSDLERLTGIEVEFRSSGDTASDVQCLVAGRK